MNRAVYLLPVLMAAGLAVAPMARAETDTAASEIAALRQELKALATRNQQQIDSLQHQVRELSAALRKSRTTNATAAVVAPAAEPRAESASPRVAETTPPTAMAGRLPVEPRPESVSPSGMPMLPPQMLNLP